MYRKDTDGWLKHWDFILLDMICLQLAFVLAYGLSGYGFNPYQTMIYQNMSIYMDLLSVFLYDSFHFEILQFSCHRTAIDT